MISLVGTNVNEVLAIAMNNYFNDDSGLYREVSPRGMKTRELKGVTVVEYRYPWERVLFDPVRDANPFFHLLESMWILAGRNDVGFMQALLPKFREYSDDGVRFHGAYGNRLFAGSQISDVVHTLRKDPESRRAVAAIWKPEFDSGYDGKDMPCNIALTFKLRESVLHMTVYNRSNDLVWGALGANAVQFPFIAEYVAASLGYQDFKMTQVTDSMHLYVDNEPAKTLLKRGASYQDHYSSGIEVGDELICPEVKHLVELGESEEVWDTVRDIESLFSVFDFSGKLTQVHRENFRTYFFRDVVAPMWNAYGLYRQGNLAEAHSLIGKEHFEGNLTDWIVAGYLWLDRRVKKGSK